MKFKKYEWEKRTPVLSLTAAQISTLIEPYFGANNLKDFKLINTGLANTNIQIILNDADEQFLLRIYTRDHHALAQEKALSEKYGKRIAMPHFLYVNENPDRYSYGLQKWIPGIPFYQAIEQADAIGEEILAKNLALALSSISQHRMPTAGFFDSHLQVLPFEQDGDLHPFISYVQDCLFKGNAGKWLGGGLSEMVWGYLQQNQEFFPSQEPATLVHGDFNPDNILVDEHTYQITGILDWEYAFAGSPLFDLGTLLRWQWPAGFEENFINSYQAMTDITLPVHWRKMLKLQDLTNLIGLLNTSRECLNLNRDVKTLIQNTLNENIELS